MAFKNLLRTFATYVAACAVAISGTGLMRLPVAIAEVDAKNLVINEISWGSASTQWIELYNPGAVEIDLAATPFDLQIDKSGTTVTTVKLDGSLPATSQKIAPKSYMLLSYVPVGKVSTLQVLPEVVLDTPLPTEHARYVLKTAEGVTVDQADNGNALPIAGADRPVVASMYRVFPVVDGTLKEAWGTSQTVGTGFKSSTEEYGTPQNRNSVNVSATYTNPEVDVPSELAISAITEGAQNTGVTVMTGAQPGKSVATTVRITHENLLTKATVTLPEFDTANPEKPYTSKFNLLPGMYRVYVYAVDADGNRSAAMMVRNGTTVQGVYVVRAAGETPSTPVLTKYTESDPGFTKENHIALEGTAEAGSLIVSVNNAQVKTVPMQVETNTFFIDVALLPNQKNVIEVRAKDGDLISEPAFAYVYQDTAAPVIDKTKVTLTSNRPGITDTIQASEGAIQDVTLAYGFTLKVCADAACTNVIVPSVSILPDGSFAPVELGDNAYATVYLLATDKLGNQSEPVQFDNPIVFEVPGGMPLTVKASGTDTITVSWSPVPGAVGYRLKYKNVGGAFGDVVNVCFNTPTCAYEYTFSNLQANTRYVFAISAVDMSGNETVFTETQLGTKTVVYDGVGGDIPAAQEVQQVAQEQTRVPSTTRVMPTPTPTPTVTPQASPTPDEDGEVKSAETDNNDRNWTPWIILAILVGLAILAITGYFYWFGGDAGEEALKSVEAEKKADTAKDTPVSKAKEETPAEDKKSSKRW